MAIHLIYAILFFALFGGLLFTFGILKYFVVGTECLIYILFLIAYIKQPGRYRQLPHLWYSFFFMLIITAISMTVNESGAIRALFSLRLLFRFFFFYLAIIALRLDDDNLKKINMFVTLLLLMQLPVVAIKFLKYGIAERTMGAYGGGGSLTTMLPISVIFYFAAYYFLYQRKRWYILAGIGFVLFSIVGKKRAVFFLYPFQFMAIYYYIYLKGTAVQFSKKVGMFFLFSILIVGVSIPFLYFNKTLNPDGQVGGSLDLKYALDFAVDYTTHEDGYGYSSGRVATTKRVFGVLWYSGFDKLAVGFGPGSITTSLFDSSEDRKNLNRLLFDKFKIIYGWTSMTKIVFEYGILGVLAYSLIVILLARMCWRYYKYETDPYWRAFAAGSVGFAFSMLFFFLAYHHPAFWGDTLPCLYFYAMAVVYTRLQKIGDHVPEIDSTRRPFETSMSA
jgi:hypothetical protein